MVLVRLRLGVSVGEGNVRGEAEDDGGMFDGWVVIPKSDIALQRFPIYPRPPQEDGFHGS